MLIRNDKKIELVYDDLSKPVLLDPLELTRKIDRESCQVYIDDILKGNDNRNKEVVKNLILLITVWLFSL
jgi:hypothetical protein